MAGSPKSPPLEGACMKSVLIFLSLAVLIPATIAAQEPRALTPRQVLQYTLPTAYEALLRVEHRHGRTYTTEEDLAAALRSEAWYREYFLEYEKLRNELCALPAGHKALICQEAKRKS